MKRLCSTGAVFLSGAAVLWRFNEHRQSTGMRKWNTQRQAERLLRSEDDVQVILGNTEMEPGQRTKQSQWFYNEEQNVC